MKVPPFIWHGKILKEEGHVLLIHVEKHIKGDVIYKLRSVIHFAKSTFLNRVDVGDHVMMEWDGNTHKGKKI